MKKNRKSDSEVLPHVDTFFSHVNTLSSKVYPTPPPLRVIHEDQPPPSSYDEPSLFSKLWNYLKSLFKKNRRN